MTDPNDFPKDFNLQQELSRAAADYKVSRMQRKLSPEHRAQLDQAARDEQESYLRKRWTPAELIQFVEWRMKAQHGITLIQDVANFDTVQALAHYFTESPAFETMGDDFSLAKGLLLRGGYGVGKSILMRAFMFNQKQCYTVRPCRVICKQYAADGAEAIYHLSGPIRRYTADASFFWQKAIGYCYDDLGAEESPTAHYGNKLNVMGELLQIRYDLQLDNPFTQTHLTTNLTFDQIEDKYGGRVRSRMAEQFNIITVKGADRRRSNKI
jgi:DNA replication protein DnaC